MVVCAAIASFLFANKNNVSEVISSNVEALVERTGNEEYSRACGKWLAEEWIETQQGGANYVMYVSSSGVMDCDNSYTRCWKKTSAIKSSHSSTCWHIDDRMN